MRWRTLARVRANPRALGLIVLAAVLAAAALLSQTGVRLASSQTVSLVARRTEATVPLDDPRASIWDSAGPVEIPLSAQTFVVPNGGGGIRAVTARALNDGRKVYFRLEWDDATENMSAFAPQEFRDAAAIEFPANGVSTVPSFCMGQTNGQVNIWQWKADWQADIDLGFVSVPQAYPNAEADLYPFHSDDAFYPGRAAGNQMSQTDRQSPVEDLVAAGFGTLTSAGYQSVQGKGVWQDGKWYVLFARDMDVGGDDFYVPFQGGQQTNVAFAVWDGANSERDGLKSVSQFADLQIESGEGGPNTTTLAVLAVLLAVIVVAVCFVGYRERRKWRG